MTNLVKYSNPQIKIGEYIQVLTGPVNYITPPVGSNFIPVGAHNKADYPELFEKIGYQEGSVYTTRTSVTGSPNPAQPWQSSTYGNGRYLVVCPDYFDGLFNNDAVLRTSTDGISWSQYSFVSSYLGYGNGLYIAVVGTNIYTSPTATSFVSWTTRTSGTSSALYAVAYGNGIYLTGGASGVLRSSTDSITWTGVTSGTTSTIRCLIYGNGLFVFGTDGGGISTSTDGTTWIARTSGTTTTISALTYGNGLYLAGASNAGILRSSTDGITWSTITTGTTTAAIDALTYGNGVYVLASDDGFISISSNGTFWTRRLLSSVLAISSTSRTLTYGNGIYVLTNGFAVGTSTTSVDVEFSTLYNPNTQFYVPSVAPLGALTSNTSTFATSVQNIYYIRAK